MHVTAFDPHLGVILGQIFGHALGQGGDQHALATRHPLADFMQQIVNLSFHRPHFDRRIDQAGGPNDLLDHHPRRLGHLVGSRSRRDVDHLVHAVLEFLKCQRAVIERRGQTKSVLHERFLPRAVAVVHAVQLRHRLVRFVDEHQIVTRKIVQQRGRRFARQTSGEVARVIFDAVTKPHGFDHFQIKHGALMHPLGFDQASLLLQFRFPPGQFFLDGLDRLRARLFFHHVMCFGIDRQTDVFLLHCAKQRIDLGERFDFVSP